MLAISATTSHAATTTLVASVPSAAEQIRSRQWHLRYLEAKRAQGLSKGAGVIVAVLDTGVAPHPDLKLNLLPGIDTTSGNLNDERQDSDGHGTGMAGLIAAHGSGPTMGALGIAPEAKILPIRGKHRNEDGNTDELAAGIDFAIAHKADVISISAGGSADVQLQQAIRSAIQADIVVVAAAGNADSSGIVEYPASEPGVIAVGGVDRDGNHAAISVTGPQIDVVAPAVDIYSTSINGTYRVGTGTSDATAIVAGAAALIRSKYPDLPAQEVAHRLTATAIDKGPPGRDDEYGYGVIDLVAALTADVPPLGFESSEVTAPATSGAAPADGSGDGGATARGLATLGVLVAAGGGYLVWRRRRRADDPPPRISR
ncbi:type VII secretion-associated serine protease mycosin [Micromonospora sp. MS34]|uniref:type VII secretion-associated serine protease mycosin n=1 Tax=Micromonospora sp. MS34 TaxID=3385971 RepID=UPI0039A130C6